MKHSKTQFKKMLAFLLVLCMGCGISSLVTGVRAEESSGEAAASSKTETAETTQKATSETAKNSGKTGEAKSAKAASKNTKVVTQSLDEKGAFQMKVTFAGQELEEGATNNVTDAWSGNASKILNVEITRNKDVDVDPDKQYVLCMKTSEVFYFNGLPDVSKITGAEDVAMVQNDVPQVTTASGTTRKLASFSPYSGEIRIKLNSLVDNISVKDIGVSYNPELVGYTNGTQTIENPLRVQLVEMDKATTLSSIKDSDKTNLESYSVDSVQVQTDAIGGGLRTFYSMDDFKTYTSGTKANLGVDDGISFYIGSQKEKEMVYKNLTLVLHIPYIEKDGEKHYLSFKDDDTALSNNKKGSYTGYKLSEPATYDADAHTITYKFNDVYMTSWNVMALAPTFYWPEDLDKDIDTEYVAKGYRWTVPEKTCYTGAESSFVGSWTAGTGTANAIKFLPATPELSLTSNVDSPNARLAVPMIYKDVTRKNGITGFQGFFDLHNDGAGDTPEVQVDINFNTDAGDGATYYITRMKLPSDCNGTSVDYTLVNDSGDTVTGTVKYTSTSSFACSATELRKNSGVGSDYYIKSLSYKTVLRRNKLYHTETTHSYRNIVGNPGVYDGYIEGDVGTSAAATMKISSVDGKTPLNAKGDTSLTTTEKSTVSDLDFISTVVNSVTIGGQTSENITAGSSSKLYFYTYVSNEEYGVNGGAEVNGYHIMRDGIFYICLPEDVSITGKDQVQVAANGTNFPVDHVRRLDDTKCQVNGTTAYWWEVEADGINRTSVGVTIDLATNKSMAGLTWDFNNCIVLRSKNQAISRAGDSTSYAANTAEQLRKANQETTTALSKIFSDDETELGLNLYRANSSVKLNIARAEAKMDVETSLTSSESSGTNADEVTISKAGSTVKYGVKIACTEEGTAKDFNYYIPITRTDSTIDTSAMVCKKEVGLKLSDKVSIKADTTRDGDSDELPFTVSYTTDSDMTSSSVRKDSVNWTENPKDYSKVTAVKISTKSDAVLNEGESYEFSVPMQYDNSASDFEKQAGSVASWRSFGHYTYTRNGATTTNTYPCDSKSVRVRYVKDMRSTPLTLKMDASAESSYINGNQQLPTTFLRSQKLTLKSATTSSGTQLINSSPSSLTGADANSKFKISFNVNNLSAVTLPSQGSSWTVGAGNTIMLQARGDFSKALTDVTTDRYVDVVLGNDDVSVTMRIKLERKAATASVDGSGVALGEQFQVPKVSDTCSISKDSAFTALYEIKNFIPGNYSGQLLRWQDASGASATFPAGTTITMMEVDGQSKVTSYWYAKPTGSSVNLADFTRMGGSGKYSYNTSSATATSLRYLFVVNFGQAKASAGSYHLTFDAQPKSGVSAFTPVPLSVTLGKTKSYDVSASGTASSEVPKASVDYQVTEAAGNDSYTEGKSLSLVLTPRNAAKLPRDAQVTCDGEKYTCNSSGQIIIPLGTIQSGTASLKLTSNMFPEEAESYAFDGALYLSNSGHADKPGNGEKVATAVVTFDKSKAEPPAISITGTQVASRGDWSKGQPLTLRTENLSGYTTTVTTYSGLSGSTRTTDLVSSVSGMFDFKDGVGTYNGSRSSTGTLVLSSTAKTGTYRLVFEVKNASGETVITQPYYIVVR